MTKHIKFGPGHPVYDAQLLLFPELADPQDEDTDIQLREVPCPICCEKQSLEDLQRPIPSASLPKMGDRNCKVCKGLGVDRVKMKTADGYWWDPDRLKIISAGSRASAVKKTKNTNVTPFLMEFGGYMPRK